MYKKKMKRRGLIEEGIPSGFDYKLVEELITKDDTHWLAKLRGINLLAKQREERDQLRKK